MTQPTMFHLDELDSPLGRILLVSDGQGQVRALDFEDYRPRMERLLARHYGPVRLVPGQAPDLRARLAGYFAGDVAALDSIITATGGTAFQRRVWQALRTIPPGRTLTYGDLARQIDSPTAMRAVGLANGANPIGIIVPCHRVVGANGTLTGYAGGLERKRWLLAHEAAHHPALTVAA